MTDAPDPRHGTVAGYNRIPCREECCRRAMATYKARWAWDKHNGRDRIVSTLGTRRRIQALNALGWSNEQIAKRMGNDRSNLTRLIYGETMTRTLAERVAKVYDDLSMRLPTGNAQAITNVRNRAQRLGFLPPLMWDDIDNDPTPAPEEKPHGRPMMRHLWIEDAEWLADGGMTLTNILERLGCTRDNFEVACRRADRRDLYRRLAERDPVIGEMSIAVRATLAAKRKRVA